MNLFSEAINWIKRPVHFGHPLVFSGPQLFFVIHNKNHAMIFRGLVPLITRAGVSVVFVTIDGHRLEGQARGALASEVLPIVGLADMARCAATGDVICVGNDWGPNSLLHCIKRLQARGVQIAGMVEGARFLRRGYYCSVDHLLCWGPSGQEIKAPRTTIVGSPVIEAAMRRARGRKVSEVRVLVNYKRSGAKDDEGFAWGSAAIAAARKIDPEFMFSAHPSTRSIAGRVEINDGPFESLLAKASLIITKASTVIFEALASGVAVIYFPELGEERVEFACPDGAFQIANSSDELMRLARDYAAAPIFPAEPARRFLERHVSTEPVVTAEERAAAALLAMLNID